MYYLSVKKPWPDPAYFYGLPTYSQARRVAWKPLKALVPEKWLAGKPNESEMSITTVFGSTLYVLGMDQPQRLEGVQWDGGVIDESSDTKPRVFDLSVLPALSWRNGWCWRIGVPKRYGVGALEFKSFFDRGLKENEEIISFSWPSASVMTPGMLSWAMENMDAVDYAEQFEANWQRAGGRIFHAYDDVLNVSEEAQYRSHLPIVVGSDFNVDPMSWVLGHVVQKNGTEYLHIFDEISKRDTNTQHTLDALHSKYGLHLKGFDFYGDATGRARKTSASTSDYIQIRNDDRFLERRVFYPRANPLRVDRFSACNAMFENRLGVRRCIINPRCKKLRADLEVRAYKEGSREPDDYGNIGHMSDALGYVIHKRFPIRLTILETSMTASTTKPKS